MMLPYIKQIFGSNKPETLSLIWPTPITNIIATNFIQINDFFMLLRGISLLQHENARTLCTIAIVNEVDSDIWMNHGANGFDATKVLKNTNNQYLDINNNIIPNEHFLQCLQFTLANDIEQNKLKTDNPTFAYQLVAFDKKNIEVKTIQTAPFKEINKLLLPSMASINLGFKIAKQEPADASKLNYDSFIVSLVEKQNESNQFIFYNTNYDLNKLKYLLKQERKHDKICRKIYRIAGIKYNNYYNAITIPVWETLFCGKWLVYDGKRWIKDDDNLTMLFSLDQIMHDFYGVSQIDLKNIIKKYLIAIFKNLFKKYLTHINAAEQLNRQIAKAGRIYNKTQSRAQQRRFKIAINTVNKYMDELTVFYSNLTNNMFTPTEIQMLQDTALKQYLSDFNKKQSTILPKQTKKQQGRRK